jgi:hypothetical protein
VTFESGSALEEIGEGAFALSGLSSAAIPASVGVIGKSTFSCCRSLTSVTFESGSVLREIGEEAFVWSGLKSIVIPASVGVIDQDAFRRSTALASVTFESESNLRAVGVGAFADCPCADRLEFPESLAGERAKGKT